MNTFHSPDAAPGGAPGSSPENNGAARRLRALPVQLIETEGGVILKRGCVEIKIAGDRALEAVGILLDALTPGSSVEEVLPRFAGPDRPTIERLIRQLETRNLVIPIGAAAPPPSAESHLDVFYWHFGTTTDEVNDRLNAVGIVVVGVNHVSRRLAGALVEAGVSNVRVVDYPTLRNTALFDDEGALRADRWGVGIEPVPYDRLHAELAEGAFDCLVATSDFGGLQSMRSWNELCVKKGRHFLPVVLQDLIGFVGPSVIPGETACYECFLSRLRSNRESGPGLEPSGDRAFEGQRVAGFLPSMASILGDIAAVELTKFYSRALPLWKVGTFIEVNMVACALESHKVLRVPRCPVCSTLVRRSSASFIKGSMASEVIAE